MPSNSKEYSKEYYAKHKATTSGKQSELIRCEVCDKNISKWNVAKHNKTAKHILNATPKSNDILKELEIIKLELRELKKSKDTTDPLVMCWGCSDSFKESEKSEHKCKKKPRPICKLKE